MELIDYSKEYKEKPSVGKHSPLFPKNIFCVIAGSTGCGKTLLLTNLLRKPDVLNFKDFYVYCPTLHQDAYTNLKQHFEEQESAIENEYKRKTNKNKVIKCAHFYDTDDNIKDPRELDPNFNHIMIFDDVMMKDQKIIKEYFCTGRHNNVNVFYLVQSLHKIQKHCIRENANMFILFKQRDKTLKYFYEDTISGDMEFEEFKQFCYKTWSKPHGFVVINLWDDISYGRYWANYTHVYTPQSFLLSK